MKLCIGLILVFLVTRCPLEIIQFKELIHAAEGFKFNNIRPDQLGKYKIHHQNTC